MPGECVTNALPIDDGLGSLWSLDVWHMWDALRELLMGEVAVEGGVAVGQPLLEEADKEGRPIGPGFWHGEDALEEGREVPISEKAQGKAPAVELPPPEADEELAQHTMVPPVEDPDYVTWMNLDLVPALWPGRDKLEFATAHQTIFAVHPT